MERRHHNRKRKRIALRRWEWISERQWQRWLREDKTKPAGRWRTAARVLRDRGLMAAIRRILQQHE